MTREELLFLGFVVGMGALTGIAWGTAAVLGAGGAA